MSAVAVAGFVNTGIPANKATAIFSVAEEGIETEEQLRILREQNAEYGQGFLFSKPLNVDDTTALLKAKPSW